MGVQHRPASASPNPSLGSVQIVFATDVLGETPLPHVARHIDDAKWTIAFAFILSDRGCPFGIPVAAFMKIRRISPGEFSLTIPLGGTLPCLLGRQSDVFPAQSAEPLAKRNCFVPRDAYDRIIRLIPFGISPERWFSTPILFSNLPAVVCPPLRLMITVGLDERSELSIRQRIFGDLKRRNVKNLRSSSGNVVIPASFLRVYRNQLDFACGNGHPGKRLGQNVE